MHARRHRSERDGDADRAADGRRADELYVAVVDVPSGKAHEHLLDRDARFEPGEMRTEAVVHAETEAHVAVERPGDVEAIGIGELTLVASGRAREQRDLR